MYNRYAELNYLNARWKNQKRTHVKYTQGFQLNLPSIYYTHARFEGQTVWIYRETCSPVYCRRTATTVNVWYLVIMRRI